MTQGTPDGLAGILRRTLEHKKVIAIVGWKDSDHDHFTKNLNRDQVAFARRKCPEGDIGYLIATPVITPAERGKATKGVRAHPKLLGSKEIKSALLECKDLLRIPEIPTRENPETPREVASIPKPTSESVEVEEEETLLDLITDPKRTASMNNMDAFIVAFEKEAAVSGGSVGSRTLAKIVSAHGVPNAQVLAKEGLIVPIVSEGKNKIGRYKAGEKMTARLLHASATPSDPLDAIRFLVSQKPEIERSIEEHEKVLQSLREKLQAINQAEGHLAQLTTISQKLTQ